MPSCDRIFDIEDKEASDADLLVPSSLASASDNTTINTSDQMMLSTIAMASTTTPTPLSTSSVHPLDCAWLTRSLTSDEFEKFLTQEAAANLTTTTTTTAPNFTKYEEEEIADLENFLTTSSAYLTSSSSLTSTTKSLTKSSSKSTVSTPAASTDNSKKRGRPAKPDPASLLLATANAKPAPTPKVAPASPKREGSPDLSDKYLKMRKSNNESSMKSRLRRKEREAQNLEMVEKLVSENAILRDQLASLRAEFAQLKSILEKSL